LNNKVNQRSAFTLIELLLGLSIFAMIAVSVYSTFSGGILVNARSQKQNHLYREIRWSMDVMAKELENMVAYDFSGSYPEKKYFIAEDKKISFLLATDDGLKMVSYYLMAPHNTRVHKILIGRTDARNVSQTFSRRQGIDAEYLVREEVDFADYVAENVIREENIEIIAVNVKAKGLEFTYNFSGDKDEGFEQAKEDKIPAAVRISIDFLSDDADEKESAVSKSVVLPLQFRIAQKS